MLIGVGDIEKKVVSEQNNKLFKKIKEILEDNQHMNHIGWSGVGKVVDYLETFYDIENPKNFTIQKLSGIDFSLVDDIGIVIAYGSEHLLQTVKEEGTFIYDQEDSKHRYSIVSIKDSDEYGMSKVILDRNSC